MLNHWRPIYQWTLSIYCNNKINNLHSKVHFYLDIKLQIKIEMYIFLNIAHKSFGKKKIFLFLKIKRWTTVKKKKIYICVFANYNLLIGNRRKYSYNIIFYCIEIIWNGNKNWWIHVFWKNLTTTLRSS